jgi:phosphate transport system protein
MTDEKSLKEYAPDEIDHRRDIGMAKQHIREMSTLATGMVADGTRALLTADIELSKSVISRDAPLDLYDLNIETEVIRLVAVLQPEGPDLRTTEAMLKIANCVDRVGRLGYDLARYIVPVPPGGDAEIQSLLRPMDARSRAMVTEAMDAFLAGDADRSKAVFVMDDEVDSLHKEIQNRIITMLRKGGPAADRLAFELLAARHLERVADNACKIAEYAVYAITGQRRREYFDKIGHPSRSPEAPGNPTQTA